MTHRTWLTGLLILAAIAGPLAQGQPRGKPHGRLFPPQDLGLLEAPDRDIWQHPDQIMDTLSIAEASIVADIGAGAGWFTVRLARRVGPNGRVYAEDVQPEMVTAISRRVAAEGLLNVKPVLGKGSDPGLPRSTLHAMLMVDAYHEIDESRVTLLRNLAKSLRPEGRIGVVDFKLEGGGPGPPTEERVPPEDRREGSGPGRAATAARRKRSCRIRYFLIFGLEPKPTTPASDRHRCSAVSDRWLVDHFDRPRIAHTLGSTAPAMHTFTKSAATNG